jgi:hypothetical protein
MSEDYRMSYSCSRRAFPAAIAELGRYTLRKSKLLHLTEREITVVVTNFLRQ